jgi:hypothetical protein
MFGAYTMLFYQFPDPAISSASLLPTSDVGQGPRTILQHSPIVVIPCDSTCLNRLMIYLVRLLCTYVEKVKVTWHDMCSNLMFFMQCI